MKEEIGDDFLYYKEFKKPRELWVLGSFINLLKANDEFGDIFYVEQEAPDFRVLKINSYKKEINIEVLEVLHPGRERSKENPNREHSIPFDNNFWIRNIEENTIDIWESFRTGLQNKLSKNYGDNAWLLIYHNIPKHHISNYGWWINSVCAKVEEWVENKLIDFSNIKLQRIFVVNCNADELMSIYPEFKVLYSEYEQYFRKIK